MLSSDSREVFLHCWCVSKCWTLKQLNDIKNTASTEDYIIYIIHVHDLQVTLKLFWSEIEIGEDNSLSELFCSTHQSHNLEENNKFEYLCGTFQFSGKDQWRNKAEHWKGSK
ncbi:hypothetical protein ACJIZ3_007961 [Penstemon smallii]|uniref:Uncharacterized protein n=1 Tax=Penstemon smallii TaxID=265156 RepID=A0ABD3T8E8_9LAMI